jgi:hypothetical protein
LPRSTHDITRSSQTGPPRRREKSNQLDRAKYGVTYNSETSVLKKAIKIAKDKVIKDMIKISLQLQSQAI